MDRKEVTETLELDATTANLLSQLAETWGVSVEEAVRRAVQQVNAGNGSPNKEARLEAFKELQRRLGLTSAKAAEWQDAIHEARR
jgi:hypothetical protein